MTSAPILPPADPDQDCSLPELLAQAHAAPPAARSSGNDDELYRAVDLSSWAPPPPAVVPHLPPPPPGRSARIAATASLALAVLAVCTAGVLTWSQTATDATEAPRALAPDALPTRVAVAALRAARPAQPTAARPAEVVVAAVARPAGIAASTTTPTRQLALRSERRVRRGVEATPSLVPPAVFDAPPPPAVGAAPRADLPDVPSRESVIATIDSVRPALQSCAAARHGAVGARITVAASGRVQHAIVSGAFAGTPEGSCMARALRGARFEEFEQATVEVSYPFAF